MIDTAIGRFRRREQTLMRATGTVRRPSANVVNPTTLVSTPVTSVVYSGLLIVRPLNQGANTEPVGDDPSRAVTYMAKFPADTPVAKGDVVTVDSAPDAGLVGRAFRLQDVLGDVWEINRRCVVEEVVT